MYGKDVAGMTEITVAVISTTSYSLAVRIRQEEYRLQRLCANCYSFGGHGVLHGLHMRWRRATATVADVNALPVKSLPPGIVA